MSLRFTVGLELSKDKRARGYCRHGNVFLISGQQSVPNNMSEKVIRGSLSVDDLQQPTVIQSDQLTIHLFPHSSTNEQPWPPITPYNLHRKRLCQSKL